MKRRARSAALGETTPFPASLSMSSRANTNFRFNRTTVGRANMRRRPRSGPMSRTSPAIAASPNSFALTRRSSSRVSVAAAGTLRPRTARPTSPTSSSAPPAFCTSRCFLTSRDARISPARPSTRRAGTTMCRMTASAGVSSAAAPVVCRSPKRWLGRDATSPSSFAAHNGSIFATTHILPGASG